jgi:hypothetical protein
MKICIRPITRTMMTALAALFVAGASAAQAQVPLKINQTQGFGANKVLEFTYTQQFDCVVQPFDDRNFNGKVAAEDSYEFSYKPECQVGAPSTIDPTGLNVSQTDKLYVIVPFFETNPSEPAFSPKLGAALKSLLGFVPDAFKVHPGVAVQCPEPGAPDTQQKGRPGTCTMHPDNLDLGPALTALGLLPAKTNLYLPLVNHSHILPNSTINQTAEWWQVEVVLVSDPSAWPTADGGSGITSFAKMRAAQANKQALPDVATNFFLFFASKEMAGMSH